MAVAGSAGDGGSGRIRRSSSLVVVLVVMVASVVVAWYVVVVVHMVAVVRGGGVDGLIARPLDLLDVEYAKAFCGAAIEDPWGSDCDRPKSIPRGLAPAQDASTFALVCNPSDRPIAPGEPVLLGFGRLGPLGLLE